MIIRESLFRTTTSALTQPHDISIFLETGLCKEPPIPFFNTMEWEVLMEIEHTGAAPGRISKAIRASEPCS
jgi:hypothetical protein